MDLEAAIFDDGTDPVPDEFKTMAADDLRRRSRLLDNEIRVLKVSSSYLCVLS